MFYLPDIALTAFYACFGIALMVCSNAVMDFFIPGNFGEEIRRGNRAVAWLSAGSFIGIGEILRAVISTPVVGEVDISFLHGVAASFLYAVIGIAFFVLGFFVIRVWHRKYRLDEEIQRGNTAAGIMVFGIFVGLSLVISGAVH